MEIYQCRICLEEDNQIEELIKPCKCDGTHKFVHRKCLNKWININRNNINGIKCPECMNDYIFEYDNYYLINIINIIKKYYIFTFLISYLLFLVMGLFGIFISNTININYLIRLSSINYYSINIILLGNIIFCNINFFYYLIHFIITVIFFRKNLEWKDTLKHNLNKMLVFSFISVLLTMSVPIIGVIYNFLVNKSFFIYFIDFWFSRFYENKIQVINLLDHTDIYHTDVYHTDTYHVDTYHTIDC